MQQKWNQNFDGEPMTDIPQKFLNLLLPRQCKYFCFSSL